MLTKRTQQAIDRMQRVPSDRQDQLAALLLHEIEQDERWAESTQAGEAGLKRLVDDVLGDDDAGRCPPLDPDRL